MSKLLKPLHLWLPILFWACAIFYLSHIPYLRITDNWWDYPLRKLGHMGEFGALALLLTRALSGSTAWPGKKIFITALTLTVLYAVSDEVHQHFVAGRFGALQDVLIDALGAWITLRLPRAWAVMLLALGAYAMINGYTLRFPAPLMDEVAFADIAAHHELTIWPSLTPSAHFVRDMYGMGFMPGYIVTLRTSLRLLEIGLAPARFVALLFGLVQLTAFLFLLRRWRAPATAWIALAAYAGFTPFLAAQHLIRPDLAACAASAVVLAWLFTDGGVAAGFIMGVIASLALFFHPQGIFLFAVMPIIMLLRSGRAEWFRSRMLAWAIGAAVGVAFGLQGVDFQQALRYKAAVAGKHLVDIPALFQLLPNPLDALSFACQRLTFSFDSHPTNLLLLSGLLAALGCQLRRYRTLQAPLRDVFLTSVIYGCIYVLLVPSPTRYYVLVFCPWWFIQAGWFLHQVAKGEVRLNRTDAWIAAFTQTLVFAHGYRITPADSAVLLGTLWTIAFLFRTGPRKEALWGLLMLAVVTVWCPAITVAWIWAHYQTIHNHGFVVGLAAALILLIKPDMLSWSATPRRWVPTLAAAFIVFYMGLHATAFVQSYRTVGPQSWRYLNSLPSNQVVLTIDEFWLCRPDWRVLGLDAIFLALNTSPEFPIHARLRERRPQWLLWPLSKDRDLNWVLAQCDRAGIRYQEKDTQPSPWGPMKVFQLNMVK